MRVLTVWMLRLRARSQVGQPKVSEVASGVYAVRLGPGAAASSVYLVRCGPSWTLIDAGWIGSEKRIKVAAEAVFGPDARPASMILTHLHPDHSGATRPLAELWGQRAYVHPAELPLAVGYLPEYAIPLDRRLVPLIRRLPRKTQARIATGSDLTAVVQAFDPAAGVPGMPGWSAIHTPGHTPGHISLYRSADGVLITGDAVTAVDMNSLRGVLTGKPGIFGPPRYTTWNSEAAQRSIGVLAGLAPKVVATGHGRVQVDQAAPRLRLLASGHDSPARWRQGLFAPVDYSARTRYRPPPQLYQRLQKRLGPLLVGLGIGPRDVVVLEVPGRRSGVIRRTAVVKAHLDGDEYLVALAGESQWVRNVRAAAGRVVIGRRRRRVAQLIEVPATQRPAVIRSYLLRWGRSPNSPAVEREARLFFGIGAEMSTDELAAIARHYPVFRIALDEELGGASCSAKVDSS